MKDGRYAVARGTRPARNPDLAGLSCRWTPMPARRGAIVSLLVQPRDGRAAGSRPRRCCAPSSPKSRALDGEGTPVPAEGPGFRWPPEGLDLEARAGRKPGVRCGGRSSS